MQDQAQLAEQISVEVRRKPRAGKAVTEVGPEKCFLRETLQAFVRRSKGGVRYGT